MLSGKHILVIRPGAVGDAVLTLPALHALRAGGAAGLTVLGTPASWGFVRKAHEGLRIRDFSSTEWLGLFSGGGELGPSARAMLAQTEAAVIYLRGDTAPIEAALHKAGVKEILAAEAPVGGSELLQQPQPAAMQHASRSMLDPLAKWLPQSVLDQARCVVDAANDVFLMLDEHERNKALEELGVDSVPAAGLVGIHPGSGGRRKCWPAEFYAKLVVQISCRSSLTPLVFFGPADEAVRDAFEAAIPGGVYWECAAGLSLRSVFALLGCCKRYIGNDAGITHLAARACETIALFGPTDPAIWAPLGKNVRVLRAPKGDLAKLKVETVLSEALSGE